MEFTKLNYFTFELTSTIFTFSHIKKKDLFNTCFFLLVENQIYNK